MSSALTRGRTTEAGSTLGTAGAWRAWQMHVAYFLAEAASSIGQWATLFPWESRAAQSHQARPEEPQEPSSGAAKGAH